MKEDRTIENGILGFLDNTVNSLNNTKRWGTFPTVREETVSQHTFMVMNLSYHFAIQIDEDVDMGKLLEKGMHHDFEEAFTNDIPRWAKRKTDSFYEKLEEVEDMGMREMVSRLPEENADRVYSVWKDSKDDSIEGQLVAAADIILAIYEVFKEKRVGNQVLEDYAQVDRGVEHAFEICEGIDPAIGLLEDLLVELGRYERHT